MYLAESKVNHAQKSKEREGGDLVQTKGEEKLERGLLDGSLLGERQRPKDVESVQRRRDDYSRDLRMPVNLLDLTLPLVDEQELSGDVLESFGLAGLLRRRSLVLVHFDGEIPQRDLVICSRGSEAGVFRWVPFDRRYWCGVPRERSDRGWGGRFRAVSEGR